jgi:predicted molibdopterin-dependent oxidoreductase YjgC
VAEETLEGRVFDERLGSRRVVRFHFDGEELQAYAGETVASALIAAGRRTLRRTAGAGEARGVFCGMGVCFECLVEIDGRRSAQACLTPVAEGMRVETQLGEGSPEPLD